MKLQVARKSNINDRARDRCHEPICSFVFMHGSGDHHSDCVDRHMILETDILTGNLNHIANGTLRFHVIKTVSPTQYIVRPTMLKRDGQNWNEINGSNQFIFCDTKMQAFYRNPENIKCLAALKLGEKCVIGRHEKFYRGEILRISSKRYS